MVPGLSSATTGNTIYRSAELDKSVRDMLEESTRRFKVAEQTIDRVVQVRSGSSAGVMPLSSCPIYSNAVRVDLLTYC
jgi:hypothetical protein